MYGDILLVMQLLAGKVTLYWGYMEMASPHVFRFRHRFMDASKQKKNALGEALFTIVNPMYPDRCITVDTVIIFYHIVIIIMSVNVLLLNSIN